MLRTNHINFVMKLSSSECELVGWWRGDMSGEVIQWWSMWVRYHCCRVDTIAGARYSLTRFGGSRYTGVGVTADVRWWWWWWRSFTPSLFHSLLLTWAWCFAAYGMSPLLQLGNGSYKLLLLFHKNHNPGVLCRHKTPKAVLQQFVIKSESHTCMCSVQSLWVLQTILAASLPMGSPPL